MQFARAYRQRMDQLSLIVACRTPWTLPAVGSGLRQLTIWTAPKLSRQRLVARGEHGGRKLFLSITIFPTGSKNTTLYVMPILLLAVMTAIIPVIILKIQL